ncbi:MAG: hypothetical protein HC899_07030 [Leptolyngbyaceae cyanobacterium SM1_4_3]|nr:hypothetical protein [Leptolyngbyaceae cyanobacterium SM1_4_3]
MYRWEFIANPAGLERAEAEVRKLGVLLACNEFSWTLYLLSNVLNALRHQRFATLMRAIAIYIHLAISLVLLHCKTNGFRY